MLRTQISDLCLFLLIKPAQLVLFVLLLGTAGCESMPELGGMLDGSVAQANPSSGTIASGLREALSVGTTRAVDQLSSADGFLASAFHIPLPESLRQAQQVADRFGFGGVFDEMEIKMNRAAEAAAPKAQALFIAAIRQMTFEDVMTIYRGPDDAATRYLENRTGPELSNQMRPIIDASLAEVGGLKTFKSLADQYNRLPLVDPIDADISAHVLDYAVRALFSQVAQEEAEIRNNPAKRTTELLRQVFG
jgi:uncharacterized protein DUF4197